MASRQEINALSESEKVDLILELQARLHELESTASDSRSAENMDTSFADVFSVLEHLPVMVDAFDSNLEIVFWNRQCELITGYTKAEILNNPAWVELLYPDPEYFQHVLETWQSTGDTYRQETRIRCKDGRTRTIAWLVDDSDMSLMGWNSWAIGIDVTERKLYEQALLAAERRYRALVNQSQNPVFFGRLPNEEGIVEFNEAGARMLGYDPAQTTHLPISAVIPPDQTVASADIRERLVSGEPIPVYERILVKRDGTRLPVEINAIVIRDDDGTPIQVMSICRDISERKAMEARLRISEAWFSAVFNSKMLMVLVLDQQASIVEVNAALADALGYPRNTLQHSTFGRYVHQEDIAETMEIFNAIRRNEIDSGQATVRCIHRNGHFIWLDLVGVVQRDDDGNFSSIVVVGKDITLEKETEQIVFDLAIERERLRVIDEFIDAASHEFRTPLSRINTNLYLLRKQFDEAQPITYVDRIEDEARQILQLVEGLFRMVHLSSDHHYSFTPVDINELTRIATERIASRLEASDLRLEQVFDETLPQLLVEPELIVETLIQILDNALRFTPDGGTIRITTYRLQDSVCIDVNDSGIGIEPAVLPRVFDQFYRQDTARSTPGLGLGLSITKKIVEHHRGQINISSEQGMGTTVRIRLPIPESSMV